MSQNHTFFHTNQKIRDHVDVLVDKATKMHKQAVVKQAVVKQADAKQEVKMKAPPQEQKQEEKVKESTVQSPQN